MQLESQSRLAEAEEWFARADELGHAAARAKLGVLREERRDIALAAAAFCRADERGDPDGAFELAMLLARENRLTEAEQAFARADQRGHPGAAYNLGVPFEDRRDIDGAEAAYRRADERGHPAAAATLGLVLEQQGDVAGAAAAYHRADERGIAEGAFGLAMVLAGADRLAEAEQAFIELISAVIPPPLPSSEYCLNGGVPSPAPRRRTTAPTTAATPKARLAWPCCSPVRTCWPKPKNGSHAPAIAATPTPPTTLVCSLEDRGDIDGAATAYNRADELGDAEGAFALAMLLASSDRLTEAEEWFARAAERGHPDAALNLAALREHHRDVDGGDVVEPASDHSDAVELGEPDPAPVDDRTGPDETPSQDRGNRVRAGFLTGIWRRRWLRVGLVVLVAGVFAVGVATAVGSHGAGSRPRSAATTAQIPPATVAQPTSARQPTKLAPTVVVTQKPSHTNTPKPVPSVPAPAPTGPSRPPATGSPSSG